MEEEQIIALYFARSEDAISQTHKKYGNYCHKIAFNILCSQEDSEECVNDTYLKAWNAIPPKRPNKLQLFLGKITRHLALDRFEKAAAIKRGGGEVSLSLEELHSCLPDHNTPEQAMETRELIQLLNRFLEALPLEERKLFLMRYWNLSTIKDIAAFYGVTQSKVKTSLMRSRRKLKTYLEQEGYGV